MANIGTPMSSPIPAVGTAGTGYATQINAFLAEVQGRLEAQIPIGSLLVSTLDMQNNPITDVEYIKFYAQTGTPTTPPGSIQLYNDEFYLVTASGTIQLTSGGVLNAAGLGGITGDYGGVNPAQLRFIDADKEYYFYDDFAGGAWASIKARNVDIANANTGSTRVRVAFDGGASYQLNLPDAVPGATSVVQMDATGALTASNTLTNSITVPDVGYSSAKVASLGGSCGMTANTGSPPLFSGATNVWTHGTSVDKIVFQLPVLSGDRILSWTAYLTKTSASGAVGAELYSYTIATGARTKIGSTQSNSANAPGDITLGATGLTTVVDSAHTYFVVILPSGTTGDFTNAVSVNYDRLV